MNGNLSFNNKKKLIGWGAILVAGLILIILASWSRDWRHGFVLPVGISGFRSPLGLGAPASCQVSGEIDFVEKTIFVSKKARLKWQNVDSEGRLILWKIEPEEENFSLGPNAFIGLEMPNGESGLTIRLPEEPQTSEYRLTASITYGVLDDNDSVIILEALCSGEIKVRLNYAL